MHTCACGYVLHGSWLMLRPWLLSVFSLPQVPDLGTLGWAFSDTRLGTPVILGQAFCCVQASQVYSMTLHGPWTIILCRCHQHGQQHLSSAVAQVELCLCACNASPGCHLAPAMLLVGEPMTSWMHACSLAAL